MLPEVLSFRGRLARWPFFLSSLALVAACFVPVFLVLGALTPIREGSKSALVILIGMCVVFAAGMAWISLAIQARRLRDIGLNPLYVMPAWFLLRALDPVFATLVPKLAFGDRHQSHTMVGALIDVGLLLALLFWPSADADAPSATSRGPESRPFRAGADQSRLFSPRRRRAG